MHFCKQSFPLGALLIYLGTTTFWLKGRGPRRDSTQPCMLVSSCLSVLCPSQVWGFGLGLLSQITSQEYTAGPHTSQKQQKEQDQECTLTRHINMHYCTKRKWRKQKNPLKLLASIAVIRGFRLSTQGGCQPD